MRKLWVKAWTTLDGVFDAETMDDWWQNTNSPARMQYITEQYAQGDVYLLGRVTYEMLWPGWSTQTTGDGPGPLLNRMHKYVVSTTLTEAPWQESTIIADNVVEEIRKIKQQPGKDIIIDGRRDPGAVAGGNRADRRVPDPGRALHHGEGQALLPGRDAFVEAAAGRKQDDRVRDAGAGLPAGGRIRQRRKAAYDEGLPAGDEF